MEPAQFGALNYTILALYLTGMMLVGLFFARRQENVDDFFLGGRKLPWLAVAMSMYASLTSTVTYLGLLGTAYSENISLTIVCRSPPPTNTLKNVWALQHAMGLQDFSFSFGQAGWAPSSMRPPWPCRSSPEFRCGRVSA